MKISLIICTRNRDSQLDACLKSLTKLKTPFYWEPIIVDNASTDGTQSIIKYYKETSLPNLINVIEPKKGLSRARNCGWKIASAPIVTFTDDDCYPDPDFLINTLLCFEEESRLGFIGGRVLLHDPTDYPITIQERSTRLLISPKDFIPAGLIHGANFSFRREVLEQANGFDPLLGAGTKFTGEDVDIQARISAMGWYGAYDPRPMVYHHHQRKTQAEADQLMKQYDRGRGAYYVKCLLNPTLRKTYAKHWYWSMRRQPLKKSYHELIAGMEYLVQTIC